MGGLLKRLTKTSCAAAAIVLLAAGCSQGIAGEWKVVDSDFGAMNESMRGTTLQLYEDGTFEAEAAKNPDGSAVGGVGFWLGESGKYTSIHDGAGLEFQTDSPNAASGEPGGSFEIQAKQSGQQLELSDSNGWSLVLERK